MASLQIKIFSRSGFWYLHHVEVLFTKWVHKVLSRPQGCFYTRKIAWRSAFFSQEVHGLCARHTVYIAYPTQHCAVQWGSWRNPLSTWSGEQHYSATVDRAVFFTHCGGLEREASPPIAFVITFYRLFCILQNKRNKCNHECNHVKYLSISKEDDSRNQRGGML